MATLVPASSCCSLPSPLFPVAPPKAATAGPACVSGNPLSPPRESRSSPWRRLTMVGAGRGSCRCFVRSVPSGLASAGASWEDPDDECCSEREVVEGWEDEDELEVKETSGGVVFAERNRYVSPPAASESERLRHEVELLLNSEEKGILQQNEAPNLSKISSSKWKPFHTRALSGQIPYMDDLLQHGVDIDATDKDGLTALHKAIISKKEAVTSHLLRKGANPHVRDKDGATLLHYAVQVGAMQTVKLLIKYKIDVNIADMDGWTPLHLAIQSGSRDMAKVLLVNGADKTRRNKDGKTPLDLNLCFGKDFKSYELAKLLKLVPANE